MGESSKKGGGGDDAMEVSATARAIPFVPCSLERSLAHRESCVPPRSNEEEQQPVLTLSFSLVRKKGKQDDRK